MRGAAQRAPFCLVHGLSRALDVLLQRAGVQTARPSSGHQHCPVTSPIPPPHAPDASAQTEWDHRVPQLAYIVVYLVSAVLCLAVGIMLSYHVWSISWGETTVEGQDHEVYTKKAKSRGETFVNSYDLGPLYTLFVPFRIMPYTDGRSWARREGYERHHGIRRGEELTDEEEDDA
ncbi:hypothetical protein DXG01_001379 [Tephrocybe rancida]|nr:hypothetical protein DXG01_001379 [Tephrocybe rancida]